MKWSIVSLEPLSISIRFLLVHGSELRFDVHNSWECNRNLALNCGPLSVTAVLGISNSKAQFLTSAFSISNADVIFIRNTLTSFINRSATSSKLVCPFLRAKGDIVDQLRCPPMVHGLRRG